MALLSGTAPLAWEENAGGGDAQNAAVLHTVLSGGIGPISGNSGTTGSASADYLAYLPPEPNNVSSGRWG